MQPITLPRRSSAEPSPSTARENAESYPDDDLVPIFAILWFASVARVVAATIRHETFGTDLTLALLAVLFLPVLLFEPLRWLLRLRRRESHVAPATDGTKAPVIALVPKDRTAAGRPGRI